MSKGRDEREDAIAVPREDREQFIRDNAVALVAERDAKIERLRKRIADLEKSRKALRGELAARPQS